jgi:hypothetical protein
MNNFESKDPTGGKLFKKPEYIKPPASDKKKMQSSFNYEKEEIEDIVDLERESLIKVIEKLKKKARVINLTLIFRGTQGRIVIKSGLISEIYFDEYQDLDAFIYLIQITEEDLIRYLPLYKKKKLEEEKILEHLESMIKYKPEDLIFDSYDEEKDVEDINKNDNDLNYYQGEDLKKDKLENNKLELREKNEENILLELDQEIENILQSLEVENKNKKMEKEVEDKINKNDKIEINNTFASELNFDNKSMESKNVQLVDEKLNNQSDKVINMEEQDVKEQEMKDQEVKKQEIEYQEFKEEFQEVNIDKKFNIDNQENNEISEYNIENNAIDFPKDDLKINSEELELNIGNTKGIENMEFINKKEDNKKEEKIGEAFEEVIINNFEKNSEFEKKNEFNKNEKSIFLEDIKEEVINEGIINKSDVVKEVSLVNVVEKEGDLEDSKIYEKQIVNNENILEREDILEKKENIKEGKLNIIEDKIERDNYNRREEKMIDLANLVSKIKGSIPTVEEVMLINIDTEEVEDSSHEVNEFIISSLIAIYKDLQLFYTLINEEGNNIIIELANSYLILQNLGSNLILYSRVSKKANPSLIASIIHKILRK